VSGELQTDQVDAIGLIAGQVWEFLNESGPVTLSKLSREIEAPRDLIMQGVGWLAREDKIEFRPGARSKQIALR